MIIKTLSSMTRPVTLLLCVSILAISGCSKSSNKQNTTANSTENPQTQTASKLGDLSAFANIARDVKTLVDQGKLSEAKTRIKDLEMTWDSSEAGLKPRAADDWHVLDKQIDAALTALRADQPNQADCKAAMDNLVKAFDRFQMKK